jgi:hypothetical protein
MSTPHSEEKLPHKIIIRRCLICGQEEVISYEKNLSIINKMKNLEKSNKD